MRLLVLLLALICGSAHAQILTYKHWPPASCPVGSPATCGIFALTNWSGYVQIGFPEDPSFTKLRDETGLRCHLAADFVTSANGPIYTDIMVDDGAQWSVGNSTYTPANTWVTQFWGITFDRVPAGRHDVRVLYGGAPGAMYTKYALLQCFEEMLGAAQ